MKNKFSLLYLLVTLMVLTGCDSGNKNRASTDAIHHEATADSASRSSDAGAPVITFVKTEHDFGKITQGEVAEFSFKFTNTGKGQLLISNASASCGCTVPQYSKEPINPGETGFIKVTFDSDKRLDRFEKNVTITSNTIPTETVLIVRGMVIPKPEEQMRILNE